MQYAPKYVRRRLQVVSYTNKVKHNVYAWESWKNFSFLYRKNLKYRKKQGKCKENRGEILGFLGEFFIKNAVTKKVCIFFSKT